MIYDILRFNVEYILIKKIKVGKDWNFLLIKKGKVVLV